MSWSGDLPFVSGAEMKIFDIFAKAFDFEPLLNKEPSFFSMSVKVGCNLGNVGI